MSQEKKCVICGKLFTPTKYHPNQAACPTPGCQRQRQLKNIKQWRAKHKENLTPVTKEERRQKYREWRRNHQEYLKLYRESRREAYRDYMRDYMQRYRRKKSAAGA